MNIEDSKELTKIILWCQVEGLAFWSGIPFLPKLIVKSIKHNDNFLEINPPETIRWKEKEYAWYITIKDYKTARPSLDTFWTTQEILWGDRYGSGIYGVLLFSLPLCLLLSPLLVPIHITIFLTEKYIWKMSRYQKLTLFKLRKQIDNQLKNTLIKVFKLEYIKRIRY